MRVTTSVNSGASHTKHPPLQCPPPRSDQYGVGTRSRGHQAEREGGDVALDKKQVLLIDGHPIVARGLRVLLENEPWVERIREATTAKSAIEAVVSDPPDFIVLDIRLRDECGIDTLIKIRQICPEARITILSTSDDIEIVRTALRSGAHGFVGKDTEPDIVLDTLRVVAHGGTALGPRIPEEALSPASTTLPEPFSLLTSRELDLLHHLALGECNAQIAKRLGLCEKTIRNQLSRLFLRLGVRDRVNAVLLLHEARIALPRPETHRTPRPWPPGRRRPG